MRWPSRCETGFSHGDAEFAAQKATHYAKLIHVFEDGNTGEALQVMDQILKIDEGNLRLP